MRVYLPTTLPELAKAAAGGGFAAPPGGLPAHAVTGAVREWYVEGDLEELEFTAMTDAAEAALTLLAEDAGAPRRRVVVAADVPDPAVSPGGRFRSSVTVAAEVPLAKVVSVHVDEPEAVPTVEAAIGALAAAAAGDDDAQFLLDEAEATDLLWYDVSELGDVVADG